MTKPRATIPAAMREKYKAIVALIEPFCRDRLNAEYFVMCRELAGRLARRRPTPLTKGTAVAWACGIIRVIGFVNFLDDATQTPHMKMSEIDSALGVSKTTGQGRSRTIRDLFKIGRFDVNWTLPSMMERNPLAWLVMLDGMFVDVRTLPREVQEEAFQRGLIPAFHPEGNADTSYDLLGPP